MVGAKHEVRREKIGRRRKIVCQSHLIDCVVLNTTVEVNV
jgi:hypothetical protein